MRELNNDEVKKLKKIVQKLKKIPTKLKELLEIRLLEGLYVKYICSPKVIIFFFIIKIVFLKIRTRYKARVREEPSIKRMKQG